VIAMITKLETNTTLVLQMGSTDGIHVFHY